MMARPNRRSPVTVEVPPSNMVAPPKILKNGVERALAALEAAESPLAAIEQLTFAGPEGADMRVRVDGLVHETELGTYEQTYPCNTPMYTIKKDALTHYARKTLQPQLPIRRVVCIYGGAQLGDALTAGALANSIKLQAKPGEEFAKLHLQMTAAPVAHAPLQDILVVQQEVGGAPQRRLTLRRVPVSAYMLLQPAAGLDVGLPSDVVGLISSFLPRSTFSPSVRSLMCAVRAAWGVSVERQRLLFGGGVLSPAREVDSYSGLSHGAVIKLWLGDAAAEVPGAVAALQLQQELRIEGLKARPELNGQRARVVTPIDARKGRYGVETAAGERLAVRAANLVATTAVPDDADAPRPDTSDEKANVTSVETNGRVDQWVTSDAAAAGEASALRSELLANLAEGWEKDAEQP
jgi:hypothetical protein